MTRSYQYALGLMAALVASLSSQAYAGNSASIVFEGRVETSCTIILQERGKLDSNQRQSTLSTKLTHGRPARAQVITNGIGRRIALKVPKRFELAPRDIDPGTVEFELRVQAFGATSFDRKDRDVIRQNVRAGTTHLQIDLSVSNRDTVFPSGKYRTVTTLVCE